MQLLDILNTSTVKEWYPSSGLDFRDLHVLGQKDFVYNGNVFANEMVSLDLIPDLFIHTDSAYNSDNWPLKDQGVIYSDEESEYEILNTEDVLANDISVGKLLEIKINHSLLKREIVRKMLFVFSDNLEFFINTIIKHRITIEFVVNIRDGYSENGGADYSMKLLEYFLGTMNTKYLITDNFGRQAPDISKLPYAKELKDFYQSDENTPVVFQGLKEWTWSEFGLFQGDAFLVKIQRFN